MSSLYHNAVFYLCVSMFSKAALTSFLSFAEKYQSTVFHRPFINSVPGSQSNSFFAKEISATRLIKPVGISVKNFNCALCFVQRNTSCAASATRWRAYKIGLRKGVFEIYAKESSLYILISDFVRPLKFRKHVPKPGPIPISLFLCVRSFLFKKRESTPYLNIATFSVTSLEYFPNVKPLPAFTPTYLGLISKLLHVFFLRQSKYIFSKLYPFRSFTRK